MQDSWKIWSICFKYSYIYIYMLGSKTTHYNYWPSNYKVLQSPDYFFNQRTQRRWYQPVSWQLASSSAANRKGEISRSKSESTWYDELYTIRVPPLDVAAGSQRGLFTDANALAKPGNEVGYGSPKLYASISLYWHDESIRFNVRKSIWEMKNPSWSSFASPFLSQKN